MERGPIDVLNPVQPAVPPQPLRFSTSHVPAAERLAAWEEYNERELFGLRASTLSQAGLLATQTNLELTRLRFTEIVGNDHVIERTQSNIAQKPVDSIMLCLLLEGDAFFYHPEGCETLTAGDAVLYDTERPFMYGFSSAMRQVILELPRDVVLGRSSSEDAFRPRVLRLTDSVSASTHAQAAARSIRGAILSPPDDVSSLEESVLDLFGLITGQAATSGTSGYLLAAKDFVRSHLAEPDLSASRLARAVGLSERHLARAFAGEGLTPARFVMDARLARARRLLEENPSAVVAQVAAAVGFVSSAHFSRAFRERFGCSPSEARAGELAS
ncbi:AraC family transcriptional regulator [Homoserinimonas aerilata]|uniref:AraC family transcriptional regulator n=1 Tax=Homoserinimonas aerilata TaxID=1162970 RepID=A0A542YLF0_9MICO|nr:helix-turn-helix domain-containing protein [Homoserinimonas aerilata]TQL48774.1 AraC family transcriptional regulator [Homoserinimonas aerilata]